MAARHDVHWTAWSSRATPLSRPDRQAPEGWPLAIVFDFDYTLGDSSTGVIEGANYALTGMGLPPATDDAICATIGLSLENSLVELAGEENRGRAEDYIRLFVEKADAVMADSTVLYDFVPGVLAELKSRRVAMGIVTQKFKTRIDTILARDGLEGIFEVIVGADTAIELKPHPGGLLSAVSALGCTPQQSLYVGDSGTDAETARRACVPFLPVLTGVTPREAFDGYDALCPAHSVAELPKLVDTWRGAP